MQITDLHIRNFKSIGDMRISNVENALILVGKNNTGKTAVLDAVRAVSGSYQIQLEDFQENYANIEIGVTLAVTPDDLQDFHDSGTISTYRKFDSWYREFCRKLPSFQEDETTLRSSSKLKDDSILKGGSLTFVFTANRDGKVRYNDGFQKHNPHIQKLFPIIYYMDCQRNLRQFQEDLLLLQEDAP